MLRFGCVGIPGRSSRAWLGGEDCSVGGGGPRREEVEPENQRSPLQTSVAPTGPGFHCKILVMP